VCSHHLPYGHTDTISTACGQAAIISSAGEGYLTTCTALQHDSSDGRKNIASFSSTGSVSFLVAASPVNFELQCIRHLFATFSWLPPPSPPPLYLAVLVVEGKIVGQRAVTAMSSLPFERTDVSWLLPSAARWVSSCVASVYHSEVCIRSNSGGGGAHFDDSFVQTGCVDSPFVNLNRVEVEISEPSMHPHDPDHSICLSHWVCKCVRVGVEFVSALAVVSNSTHGMIAVTQHATGMDMRGAMVRGLLEIALERCALSSFVFLSVLQLIHPSIALNCCARSRSAFFDQFRCNLLLKQVHR
jgi:hypothetical protein